MTHFLNREFAAWMLVSVPLFVASILVLETIFGTPPLTTALIFVGGMVFNELTDPFLDHLLDRKAERTDGATPSGDL
jgi:heme O synthase-like polyprenyltransferase